MNIGDNVVKLRKSKGWSQEDLAEIMDVSRQSVSKWEHNNSRPDLDKLILISQTFKVSIDDIVNNRIQIEDAVLVNFPAVAKKKKYLKWVIHICILILILFFLQITYNFIVLLSIVNTVEDRYAELDNYHYVIKKYDGLDIIEQEECWYKDGVSKIISNVYNSKGNFKIIYNIEYYNNKVYVIKDGTNDKMDVDLNNFLMDDKLYKKGMQLYYNLPTEITLYKGLLMKSINYNFKIYEDNIIMFENNKQIVLDRKTLLPVKVYFNDKVNNINGDIYYLIELNSVESIEI